jgi:SAM-dependent methyltransferase
LNSNWYLDEEFWRTFGPLMFNSDTFARGEEEIGQLLALLGTPAGHVLDLGAGPGRHSLPLARSGYTVTALDTSAHLLDRLRDSAGDLPIEIVQADMREFAREQTYDLVLVMWTSFGYFEDEADHARVLANIRTSLKPGGKLVLDLVGLETLCRTMEPVHLTEYDDGRLLIERPTLIDDMTRLDNEWLLIDGEAVHRTHFTHRVWSAGEVRGLLERHGFDVLAILGDHQGAEYDLEAERMIITATADAATP